MRILVVDDDKSIREFLKKSLETDCFAVDTAGDGAEGSYLGRVNNYDLILLDNTMPRKMGIEVCKEIRAVGRKSPIIVLSVESEVDDKVNLLNAGADDYLTKPFSYKELASRMRALLRRPNQIASEHLEIGDLVLDTASQRARRGSKDIYLTRKEYALIEHLMRHSGTIVSRGSLLEHVWGEDMDPFTNTIEAHILNLRRKIDFNPKKKLIHTVPGRGYKLDNVEHTY
jgi:DNA-binding response OmpR family regulator